MKTLYRGFTFIEVIVVIVLFVILMTVLMGFFVSYHSSYRFESALVETAGSSGNAMRDMEMLALPADQVLGVHVFTAGTYTSGASTLVLELPAIDASGNVIVGSYDYAVFYLNGTSLYRILEADPASARTSGTKLLSEAVSALVFTYDSADFTQVRQVGVDFTASTVTQTGTVTSHLREIMRLRNFI